MLAAIRRVSIRGNTADRIFWGMVTVLAVWQVITYRRDFYLIIDDWAFFGVRLDLLENAGVDDFLLRRHNEHLMGGMVLWDVGIAKMFGLRDYTPWVVSVQIANALVAWITWRFAARIGVPRRAAACVCPFLIAWGPFDRVGYWAPEAIFGITLALVISQFALTALSDESRRRDVVGALLGTLAVFIQSICVVVSPITVIVLAMKRRWISALIAMTPLVAYISWYLTYQKRDDAYRWDIGGSYPQVRDIGLFFDFTWHTLSRTVWQSANAPIAALLIVLIVSGSVHLWRQGGERRIILISAVTASCIYLAGFTWSRGFVTLRTFQIEVPSRYASVIAILLLPIAAVGLARICAPVRAKLALSKRAVAVIGVTSLVVVFTLNTYQRFDSHDTDMEIAELARNTIFVAVDDPELASKPQADFVFGESVFFDLINSDLLRFKRLGWL